MRVTLSESGFMRGDRPFYAIGFNYHPSVSGCQYWIRWNEGEIDRDLRAMALRGFTVVRFFVFWADFERQPGQYDEVLVGRLRRFVELAGSHGLYCIPALLTIWMNGQLFDLSWRASRDLWRDPEMVAFEVNYVAHLARALADQEHLLAYDLGDELIHVDFASSSRLSPGEVTAWQTQLADAIRREHPGVLVLQGQELSTVLGGHCFRPEYALTLDLIALHGYPLWSSLAIESVSSYKASQLVPFLAQLARVDGPVLIDELGCYGTDDEVGSGYVRASLHSALVNGARGILAWCWQDFQTTRPPYDANPAERQVGFLDASGNPRSVMQVFEQFASRVREDWGGLCVPPSPIGIFLPEYQPASGPNYLHGEASEAGALFLAYLLLKRTHLPCAFTRGTLERYQLVICPSHERLNLREFHLLEEYVAQGGTLYYSAGSMLHGFGGEDLFGVRLHDFSLDVQGMTGFCWQDQEYPVTWHLPGQRVSPMPVLLAPHAEVLATYPNGSPALTVRSYGRGRAFYLNAPLERFLNQPYLLEMLPWHRFYAAIAAQTGIVWNWEIEAPEIEFAVMEDHVRTLEFLINHSDQAVQTSWSRPEPGGADLIREQLTLGGKDVRVIVREKLVADQERSHDH